MRRILSCLKLCLLCCAFAHGVGLSRAVQSAHPRPPDAASAKDGKTDDEPPLMLSKTPTAFSVDLIRKMVNEARAQSQSDASGHAINTGFECALTHEATERYTTADSKAWLVDGTVLKEIDNDLQKIVNCTKEGDVLSFNATGVVRPSSRVTIPWQLTLMTQVNDADSNDGVNPSPKTKTTFTCPHKNSGLFLVQSMNVTFVDLIIEECAFDGTDGSHAVIDVETCHSQETYSLIALHRVVFRKNELIAASGLRMPSGFCFELEMVGVEIAENVCSGEACGVHLGKQNRLEDCVAVGNKMAKNKEQQSSLLFGAASSNTTIRGFAVRRNNVTVIRSQEGYLAVSNASFERNFLGTRIVEATKNHCFHLVKSSVQMEECAFVANEGFGGVAIFAKESKISVSGSIFNKNVGFDNGTCVYVEDSEAKFMHTISNANSAQGNGGFMMVFNSTVKLDATKASNNSAQEHGGFMRADDSNVMLDRTNATANSAQEFGGFMLTVSSTVKLQETTAANNSAQKYGGFLCAVNSTVKLNGTEAAGNNATQRGGFMLTLDSIVELEDTNATANSAQEHGGFMRAYSSNVMLDRTNAVGNNAKKDGGFISMKNSTLKLNGTEAAGNNATWGGFIAVEESNATLKHTNVTANIATQRGGFMLTLDSAVELEDTNATANSAQEHGGFMRADDSNVMLDRTNAVGNSAQDGGFISMWSSTVKLQETIAANNSAQEYGGFISIGKSTVKLDGTKAANNNAKRGGFMQVEKSNVSLESTNATSNSAQDSGGFVLTQSSTVKLDETKAANNSAKRGGFVRAVESNFILKYTKAADNSATFGGFIYTTNSTAKMEHASAVNCSSKTGGFVWAWNSTLSISQSQFALSVARSYGGFAAAFKGSSILINKSTVEQGRSENGGFIRLKKSHLVARNLSILHCEAGENGGGVMGSAASTFLCTDCTFRNNSAKHGNGGAVFFDAHSDQTLPLQLVRNHVEENTADLGGGLFFVSSERHTKCLARSIHCPVMALTDTQLSGNEASVAGGAVFAGYLEAIRLSCVSTSSDVGLRFYEEKEWKALSQLKSDKDICPSWKGNHGGVYGPNVGTYAATAEMTLDDTNKAVCVSGGENCVIEGYHIGTDLPTATVELLDELKQSPATNYRPVDARMSSPVGQFLLVSIVVPMERGACTFRSIKGFVPPGVYDLIVEFGEKAIKSIGITVRVHNCSVGEFVSNAGFCETCSSTTYNFLLSAEDCKPCPENGNCESRVITPDDGYWQQMPCSDHLHRCLPASACESQGRSEKLKTMVEDVSSCNFKEEWIENYTQAQCAEGHTGPLCGSCKEDFGAGLSSKCKKCLKGLYNVAYILTSAIILLAMTGITIHGTVSVLRGDTAQTHEQSAPSTSAEVIGSPGLGREVQTAGVPASEETLAKWKAVEMFKITLSYVQTTVLLASLDVGYAIPVIVMAAAAEMFGGLATDGIRRSVVCLTSKHLSLQPTAMALVVSVCVVPCVVLLCWIVFWTARSARSGNDGLHRYLSKRCLLSVMVIWYVTLVPVLKTALSVFLCVDVHDSAEIAEVNATHMYWAVDTSMKCYEGDHSTLLYGVVVAFVCPMYGGLFTLFVVVLKNAPQHLVHKDAWAYQTTGFLYRSYRMDHRRYWEVAIVARKAAIAFLVFCAHLFDSGLPITGVAYIIMLAILAHTLVMPYRDDFKDLNGMELASLFVSVATTLAAVMLKDESYPENFTRELLTVACALLNVIAFFVFVFYILKFAAEYLKYKLRERDELVASDAGSFRVLAHWISYEVKHQIGKICPTSEYSEIAEQSAAEA